MTPWLLGGVVFSQIHHFIKGKAMILRVHRGGPPRCSERWATFSLRKAESIWIVQPGKEKALGDLIVTF